MHANDFKATIPLGNRDSDANDGIKDIAGPEAKHHSSHDDDVTSLDTVSTATASTTVTTTSSTGNPIFPPTSASCQQCQVHYPKLVECNQIANWTLATLPQLPPQTSADDKAFVRGLDQPRSPDASANITVVMPFLQCICPDQGVLGLESCLTCFKLSSQANNNFLQELVLQNVTTSLKEYTNLCAETGNGSYVPPGHKGASASQNSFVSFSPTLFRGFAALWCALGGS
ncbi:hypothetical protein MVEG_03325 [Podila verticillata NRRL 6337]|nr:hypothetical protein MVEG_03325 [Podila verticillata NRRL 6337]